MREEFEQNTPESGESNELEQEQSKQEQNLAPESEQVVATPVSKKRGVLKEVLDWGVSIAVAVVAVVLINMFVFVQVMVEGSSMVPTLQDGDRLFATRFLYEPQAGDIVVVEPYLATGTVKGKLMFGKTLYIKRVVAVGGQTIDIKNDKVYIDGELKEEPYLEDSVRTIKQSLSFPVTIPQDSVFVMGDNREHSRDSRDQTVGILREDQVVGKAILRIYPFQSFGVLQ